MEKWFFTFCGAHILKNSDGTAIRLNNRYVLIEGDAERARETMVKAVGITNSTANFGFSYPGFQLEEQAEKYSLVEIPIEEIQQGQVEMAQYY